jgi:hypothetical protein
MFASHRSIRFNNDSVDYCPQLIISVGGKFHCRLFSIPCIFKGCQKRVLESHGAGDRNSRDLTAGNLMLEQTM